MIKKILKSLREYKKYALLTPFCVLIEVVLEVTIPFLMSRLIDDGIQNSNIDILVNATPVGMYPNVDSSPLDEETAKRAKYVLDIIWDIMGISVILRNVIYFLSNWQKLFFRDLRVIINPKKEKN